MHEILRHNRTIGFILLAVAVVVGAYMLFNSTPVAPPAYHVHADFAVYVNGEKLDFAQQRYMSEKAPGKTLAKYVHLHGEDGNVLHFHAPRVTLGDFFESIGMELDENCFTDDRNATYCKDGFTAGNVPGDYCYLNDQNQRICNQNQEIKTLKFYVNGQLHEKFGNYVPKDLDRILITYGNETPAQLHAQLQSITDNACIQSLKCPERGTPTPEDGCDVTDACVADLDALSSE